MIVDGVNFIEAECLKMSKTEFVKAHVDVFWLDRDKDTRKKMLSEAYENMKPKEGKN